ncbi:YlxM family DNA-binding protein [Desulfofalx alkaliphila]|uniref:YlxM family DNA-binding protein n=1 Tax=Desulfofalx alkaliphila TaxID=105483 RepID=UPI0004E18385|nr:putative DNA-binding protein [Desulfofalx alkaliphila]
MEKVIWITLLFDFYGQLLTERQQRFVELYYGQDFSLGEIAEEYGVTRQAVHDTLKRAEKTLTGYEEKLQLVKKFMDERKKISDALKLLRDFRQDQNPHHLEKMEDILTEISRLHEE